MRVLRSALGVVIGAWGLFSLTPSVSAAAYKLGLRTQLRGGEERLIPLFQATPWWQLAASALVTAFLLATAWRVIKGRPSLLWYAGALVANFCVWWATQQLPAYQQAFSPSELQADYYILVGMLAAGVAIWWTERGGQQAAVA